MFVNHAENFHQFYCGLISLVFYLSQYKGHVVFVLIGKKSADRITPNELLISAISFSDFGPVRPVPAGRPAGLASRPAGWLARFCPANF